MPFSSFFASFKDQSWPFLRRMLALSFIGWLPCLAQNEVNQVMSIQSSGRVTPGAEQTVKLTVKEVKRIDNGFTVIFQDGNGSLSTQTTSGITGAALEAALHDYRPGSVHEIKIKLGGLEEQLRGGGPFRGLVKKDTSSFFQRFVITDFDGRQRLNMEFGPAVPLMDPVLNALLKHVEDGKTYEFPHALDVALQGGEKPLTTATKKPAAQDALLSRYIGSWEGSIQGMPGSRLQAHYLWNEAGTALWRELTFWQDRNAQAPPRKTAVLISYDPARNAYAERIPSDMLAEPLWYAWDSVALKVTSRATDEFSGSTRINTATFVTDDRIEWKTTTETAGRAEVSSAGHYERIKP